MRHFAWRLQPCVCFSPTRGHSYTTHKNGILGFMRSYLYKHEKRQNKYFVFDSPGLKVVATRYLGFDHGRGIETPYESQPSNLIQRRHRQLDMMRASRFVGWVFFLPRFTPDMSLDINYNNEKELWYSPPFMSRAPRNTAVALGFGSSWHQWQNQKDKTPCIYIIGFHIA